MTWKESGRVLIRDSWQPVVTEWDDEDDGGDDPELEIGDIILLLDCLTEKQRFVLELRYGLRNGEVYSQREIASLMRVHHRAVERLEERALQALRKGVGKPSPIVDGGNLSDTEKSPHC